MTERKHEPGVITNPEADKARRMDKTDSPGAGQYGERPDLAARVMVGVFDSYRQAEGAVRALRAAGHAEDDISLVAQDRGATPELSADETAAGSGGATGAAAGAAAGAALAGLVTLAVPGIGALLAIGPLAAALGGGLVGGALGGLIGSMTGLGIPTDEAKAYAAAVREGKSVVTVRVGDEPAARSTEQALSAAGALTVHSYQDML